MLARARTALLALTLGLGATGCSVTVRRPPVQFVQHALRFPNDVEARIQRIEQRLDLNNRMAQYRVPGVSVAVVNRGVVEWARGYGVTDAGGSERVTQDTLFQAASVSKPVTAMAALRLVQDGDLDLDEDVNVRLKTWKVPAARGGTAVTLRQLLSHSAGVSVHGFRGYAKGESVPSLKDVLDGSGSCNSRPIRVEAPGRGYRYSGGGFVITQQLMIDTTGSPFEQTMQDIVLGPLSMTHSTYEQPPPDELARHTCAGHRADGTMIGGRWFTYPEKAAAGLWTTPTDLARFVVELNNAVMGRGRVLSRDIAVQMVTPQAGRMGLGIMTEGSGYGMRVKHGGSNQGFRMELVGVLGPGQGAVVMTNSDGGGRLIQDILQAVAAEYAWPAPGMSAPVSPQRPVYGQPAQPGYNEDTSFDDDPAASLDALALDDACDDRALSAIALLRGTPAL
jgi:CubicO group peptidase (beta-lactamase class C family)